MPSSGRCTTVASPPWRSMHGAKGRAVSSRPLQLSIAPPIVAWLVGDIAAVADDDGDAGQIFEIGGRYGVGGQRPERADGLHRLWCLIFGEYESAARLVGHTTARTFALLMAACQPGPPPWEWVTRMPPPVLSISAATSVAISPSSYAPVLGVIWRKNCSNASADRGGGTGCLGSNGATRPCGNSRTRTDRRAWL